MLELLNLDVPFGQLVVVRLGPPLPFDLDALEQLLLLLLEQVLDIMDLAGLQSDHLFLQVQDLALLLLELVLEQHDHLMLALVRLLRALVLQQEGVVSPRQVRFGEGEVHLTAAQNFYK